MSTVEEGRTPALILKVIPWLTSWVWRATPSRRVKCRGCGEAIEKGEPGFMYIYGFIKYYAQLGYLCLECGETALRAMAEEAKRILEVSSG